MFGSEESLCWSCKKPGTGGCSWDRCFVPVEGWTAEKREYQRSCSEPSFSYHVIKCPLWEKDECYCKPTGGRYSVIPQKTLVRLVRAGWTTDEIAREYRIKRGTIERRVAELKGGAKK